ncbi:MAG: C_GCAxxG_C_C family protein [Clostridia bacterium]|nr:C_GCAxxG_C_C family protein [Clostridia bacterium]
MGKYEEKARNLKNQGNNCSVSLYSAFSEDFKLSGNIPAPRSIDGKCGALLTAIRILEETGHSDKVEEFEKEFVRRFGYATCKELMSHEGRCVDYVGESARIIEEIFFSIPL